MQKENPENSLLSGFKYQKVRSLFLCFNTLPEDSGYECSDERTYDEDPDVGKGFAASEQSGTDGTCGVNACTGEVDAYQVDENQRETDSQTCEVAGCAIRLVRCTQYYQDEEGSEDNLDRECNAPASVASGSDAVCA